MSTVLLTGATGFLGSYLFDALLREGYDVVALKRSTSDTWRINHLVDRALFYDVDTQGVEAAFKDQNIDAVIHTACSYGRRGESIEQMVCSNVLFGVQVLDACVKYGTTLFCNTDTLLPRGLNDYALSKYQFAEWLRQKSDAVQVMNLKLEHMYGPKDDETKFLSWLMQQLEQGAEEIELTSGEQLRDFVYIDDVVAAFLTVVNNASALGPYSEFEVGTGKSIPVKSMVMSIKNAFDARFGPSITTLNFGAIPYREGEIMEIKVNNSLLRDLGWESEVALEQGIEKMVRAYK